MKLGPANKPGLSMLIALLSQAVFNIETVLSTSLNADN